MNILHISAHYGGGVGTVLDAWASNDRFNKHVFTHLHDIPTNVGNKFDVSMIPHTDVMVCHVWNHPSVFDFLVNAKLPDCRLVIWSHISGLYAPDTYSSKLLTYPDKFVFTTPLSRDCDEVRKLDSSNFRVIWSTYDVSRYKSIHRMPHDGFIVGYVGTADYGKLHPKFIDMCITVKSPVKFIVCSHDSQEHLKKRAAELNALDRFSFEGRTPNVATHLSRCDVFGYPLQPSHFGSCEQAIGEAMVCGAVPVVLNNPTERYITSHMRTGMVVEDISEYGKAIDYLYENRDELVRMSKNARNEALMKYDVENMVKRWNDVFNEMMQLEKRPRTWSHVHVAPHETYAISMGIYGKPFMDYVFADRIGDTTLMSASIDVIKRLYATNSAFRSESKGSIKQYLRFYGKDHYLEEWAKLTEVK